MVNLELIDEIIAKNVTITDQRLYEGVFSAVLEAIDNENEACAKVCEELGVHPALNVFNGGPEWYKHGKDCAAAIRARREG